MCPSDAADPQARSESSELRIHGVGNHDQWSALGSPTFIFNQGSAGSSLSLAPTDVGHRLLLFNWSRVTRAGARLLWYLAFPFTMINTMAAMEPARNVRFSRHHRALCWGFSLGTTALVAVWSMSAAEQVLEATKLAPVLGSYSHVVAVCVAALALVLSMLVRLRRRESKTQPAACLWHSATVAVLLARVLVLRPWSNHRMPTDCMAHEHGTRRARTLAIEGAEEKHVTEPRSRRDDAPAVREGLVLSSRRWSARPSGQPDADGRSLDQHQSRR